jgi:proteasome-associated ATPase
MGSKVVALESDERFVRNRQLAEVSDQNEKLVKALYEAREQITALKEEVDKLCAPPSTYGV